MPEGSACQEKRPTGEKPLGLKALLGGFDVVFRSHYLLLLAALGFLLNMPLTATDFEGLHASGVFALDYGPLSALNIIPVEERSTMQHRWRSDYP